jgi:hypothetical protein
MITVSGQLAIRTIHGRLGPFNVGRLSTSIGEFAVKDRELDQYDEGKYEGDFVVKEIKPSTYTTSGRTVTEVLVVLAGMTLSDIDSLSGEEVAQMTPAEADPAEVSAPEPKPVKRERKAPDPQEDTTPFGMEPGEVAPENDEALFGTLWPLGEIVKLDATVDRERYRRQCARLKDKGGLGYQFDPKMQHFVRQ